MVQVFQESESIEDGLSHVLCFSFPFLVKFVSHGLAN